MFYLRGEQKEGKQTRVKVVKGLIHRYLCITKIDKQTKESKPNNERNQVL